MTEIPNLLQINTENFSLKHNFLLGLGIWYLFFPQTSSEGRRPERTLTSHFNH